jgi:hypothetical protein
MVNFATLKSEQASKHLILKGIGLRFNAKENLQGNETRKFIFFSDRNLERKPSAVLDFWKEVMRLFLQAL